MTLMYFYGQTQTVYMNRKDSYFQGLVFIASLDLSSNSSFTPKRTAGTHKMLSNSTDVMHCKAHKHLNSR